MEDALMVFIIIFVTAAMTLFVVRYRYYIKKMFTETKFTSSTEEKDIDVLLKYRVPDAGQVVAAYKQLKEIAKTQAVEYD